MYVIVQTSETQSQCIKCEVDCKKQKSRIEPYIDIIKESQALCETRYYNKFINYK